MVKTLQKQSFTVRNVQTDNTFENVRHIPAMLTKALLSEECGEKRCARLVSAVTARRYVYIPA